VCANCVTSGEALVLNAAGLVAFGSLGWQRVRDRRDVFRRSERRRRAWSANAELMAALGHDPEVVLGPNPDAPTDDHRPVRARA
jgi:hypothetical protein